MKPVNPLFWKRKKNELSNKSHFIQQHQSFVVAIYSHKYTFLNSKTSANLFSSFIKTNRSVLFVYLVCSNPVFRAQADLIGRVYFFFVALM